ncbi:MAG: glycosyltransferase family 2 protein [Planctomycetia bacterium]|nr:glycosyltransferase family 2 protein [Planctomycetia bacterium]
MTLPADASPTIGYDYTTGPARPDAILDRIDLTLFIACYNEAENIVGTLDTLLGALQQFPETTWEALLIDDASKDRTAEVVKRWLDEHPGLPIYLKVNKKNKGLACNYIEGAFWGRGKYYRLVCGDDVEPRETFCEVLRQLGTSDMVIFYQDCRGRSLFRRLLSRTFTGLVNLISGHRLKYYNGLAIHKRYNVMRWNANYHGFGFQTDILTRLLDEGIPYKEVLVKAHERPNGHSKALTMKNLLSVSHTLLDLSIRRFGRIFFNR